MVYEARAVRTGYTVQRFNERDIQVAIDDAPASTAIGAFPLPWQRMH